MHNIRNLDNKTRKTFKIIPTNPSINKIQRYQLFYTCNFILEPHKPDPDVENTNLSSTEAEIVHLFLLNKPSVKDINYLAGEPPAPVGVLLHQLQLLQGLQSFPRNGTRSGTPVGGAAPVVLAD